MRDVHVVAGEHVLAVQPDVCHRGEALEVQHGLDAGFGNGRIESTAEPPVLGVEVAARAHAPQVGVAQR